jgi:hypothetical protein
MSGASAASLPTSVEELRALVVELLEVNAGLREVIAAKDEQITSQAARIEALERQVSKDSSTSSKPPSSDSPYRKPRGRSSRKSSGRAPGKQPGDGGTTRELTDDPDEVITCDPTKPTTPSSRRCGHPWKDSSRPSNRSRESSIPTTPSVSHLL